MASGSAVAEITLFGARELKELQAAAKERVSNLEKAAKKAEDSFCPEEAAITRKRLRIWNGEDGDPGILERIADQMSLYEPAFSDNGKEPTGQAEMFDGKAREAEPEKPVVVDPVAVKALLILSRLSATVGNEAFEKLDDLVDDDPRRIAYLGRAPLELLRDLPPIELLALRQIMDSEEPEYSEEEVVAMERLATAIALHGATLAPYHEPWPIQDEGGRDAIGDLSKEEAWLTLSAANLRTIVRQADEKAAEASAPPAEASEIEKKQEEVLVHSPASSDEFKFAVKTASRGACERALQIVAGLEGNAGREKAIRRRIDEIGELVNPSGPGPEELTSEAADAGEASEGATAGSATTAALLS